MESRLFGIVKESRALEAISLQLSLAGFGLIPSYLQMRKLRFREETCPAQGQPTSNRCFAKWGGWKDHLAKSFTSHPRAVEMLTG